MRPLPYRYHRLPNALLKRFMDVLATPLVVVLSQI